ncbi:MAG: hypothetical protein KGH64_05290 [Candidatus Micrarchaeota archaeon]|nr:hypothetical protein [Candidatus Micrarchaeota archaeon]
MSPDDLNNAMPLQGRLFPTGRLLFRQEWMDLKQAMGAYKWEMLWQMGRLLLVSQDGSKEYTIYKNGHEVWIEVKSSNKPRIYA